MKLFLMTDLEGVAGVLSGRDWLYPEGRYYENARRLLTAQANAAIEGFAAGGFDQVLVADGHGAGGLDPELLDPRARLIRGWARPPYPFGLDASFDALGFVGQHAKAGTPFSHLTHTGWFNVLDQDVNGRSIGEFGESALCAGELGIPVIFSNGEKALCEESEALTPWAVTASVLEGTIGGTGDDLSGEAYEHFHEGAIHLHPTVACEIIRERAKRAAARFHEDRDAFKPLALKPPYRLTRVLRPYRGQPGQTLVTEHPSSIIALLNSRP